MSVHRTRLVQQSCLSGVPQLFSSRQHPTWPNNSKDISDRSFDALSKALSMSPDGSSHAFHRNADLSNFSFAVLIVVGFPGRLLYCSSKPQLNSPRRDSSRL